MKNHRKAKMERLCRNETARTLPRFETEAQAHAYFRERTRDLEYVDNHRYAYVGNEIQEHAYEEAVRQGCCGALDITVMVGQNEFRMGCNYGH